MTSVYNGGFCPCWWIIFLLCSGCHPPERSMALSPGPWLEMKLRHLNSLKSKTVTLVKTPSNRDMEPEPPIFYTQARLLAVGMEQNPATKLLTYNLSCLQDVLW